MALCVFVLIASEFMPVSLLSPIAQDLHLSAGQAGQAISISGLFAFFASLLITSFIGELDRRLVLLALTGLLIVSGVTVSVAQSYMVMMIGRALLGIAIGGFWSMSAAITMRLVSAEQLPRAFAITNGGNAVASIIAAPLGSFGGRPDRLARCVLLRHPARGCRPWCGKLSPSPACRPSTFRGRGAFWLSYAVEWLSSA